MGNWFLLPIWKRIIESNHPWIYGILFAILAGFLYLAWLLIGRNTWLRTVRKVQAIGSRPERRKETLQLLGRWLGAVVLTGFAFLVIWIGYEYHHIKTVASHLSWQADEFFRATCAGMTTATMTHQTVRGVETWMPTYGKYSWRLQQVMAIVGVHELAQKSIIEDRPIPTYSDEHEWELLNTKPPSIVPTPFGSRLCTYLRNQPPKTR